MFIDIYNPWTSVRENIPRYVQRYVHLGTDLGTFTSEQTEQTEQTIELYIYMNVPTYLIARNVHGPRFTSPQLGAPIISLKFEHSIKIVLQVRFVY